MEGRRKSTRASSRTTSVDSKKSKNDVVDKGDGDDASVSSGSTRELRIVLEPISSACLNTRRRAKSTLTVDNVAALDSSTQAGSSIVAESIESDDASVSRTRSSKRLSLSQNTPKKEKATTSIVTATATPTRTRRSSRLVESIDLTQSPAMPAKRKLRSNSVASEDLPPSSPSTRRTTRKKLSESQGTPIKIKEELDVKTMTPSRKTRASRLFNHTVDEIKEEEEDKISIVDIDEDSVPNQSPKPKSKKNVKTASEEKEQLIEAENDLVSNENKIESSDTNEMPKNILLVEATTAGLRSENISNDMGEEDTKLADDQTAISVSNDANSMDVDPDAGEKSSPSKLDGDSTSTSNNQMVSDRDIESTLEEKEPKEKSVSLEQHQQSDDVNKAVKETNAEKPIDQFDSKDTKTPQKSPRALIEFMYQDESNETPNSGEICQTPKQKTPKQSSKVNTPTVEKKAETPNTKKEKIVDIALAQTEVSTEVKEKMADELENQLKDMNESKNEVVEGQNQMTPQKDVTKDNQGPQTIEKTPVDSAIGEQNIEMVVETSKDASVEETSRSPSKRNVENLDESNTLGSLNVTELINSPKSSGNTEEKSEAENIPDVEAPSKVSEEQNEMDVSGLIMTPKATSSEVGSSKILTPKKTSPEISSISVVNTSISVTTPNEKTPKSKTPSKHSNEFDDMEVTTLVSESPNKGRTSISNQTDIPKATVVEKTPTPIKKSGRKSLSNTPKNSPLSSELADQTINLDLGISQICEILNSPSNQKEEEDEKKAEDAPPIFGLPVDDGKILDNTIEPMEVDQTQIGNITTTSIDEQADGDDKNVSCVSVSSRKSVQIMTPKLSKNTSGLNRIGTPYPEKIQIDAVHQREAEREAEVRKAKERFINVVTSYQEKLKPLAESWNQSVRGSSSGEAGTSRIDQLQTKKTDEDQQPAKKAIPARNNWAVTKGLIDSDQESEEEEEEEKIKKKNSKKSWASKGLIDTDEESDREKPVEKKTQKKSTVSKSIIDTDDESDQEEPVKKKTQKKSVVDSEHSDCEKLVVTESDVEDDDDDDENERSNFIDNEADAIDDYNSGDSEDEEERREREENEIEHKGIELGSDDTDTSEDEDEYEEEEDDESLRSFIADTEEERENLESSDDEISIQGSNNRNNGRYNRIVDVSSSNEEEEEDQQNNIVAIAIAAVDHQEIIFGQRVEQPIEEIPIEEGKQFETVIFKHSDEEDSVKKSKKTNDNNESGPSTGKNKKRQELSTETDEEIEQMAETSKNTQKTTNDETSLEKTPIDQDIEMVVETPNDASTEDNQEIESKPESAKSTEKISDEQVSADAKTDDDAQESNESDISTNSFKENDTAQININIPKRKNRMSLPGTSSSNDSARKLVKELKRKSLGNLVSTQQVLTVSPAQILYDKQLNVSKKQSPKSKLKPVSMTDEEPVIEAEPLNKDDAEVNTSAKSDDSKAASSQEENNNMKPKSKKLKAQKLTKKVKKHKQEAGSSTMFDGQEHSNDVAIATTSSTIKATISMDSDDHKKPNKLKRKFVETDLESPRLKEREPKKYLGIIKSRSGIIIEEPMTPEKKDRLGFKITPMTPVNKAFRIEPMECTGNAKKSKKRIFAQIEEPPLTLPKLRWNFNENVGQSSKRARSTVIGTTEIVIRPTVERKRVRGRDLIPIEMQRFRERHLYRNEIPRQDARSLLSERLKRNADRR